MSARTNTILKTAAKVNPRPEYFVNKNTYYVSDKEWISENMEAVMQFLEAAVSNKIR